MNDEFKVTDNKDAPKELFRLTDRKIKFRVWDLKGNPAQMYVDPFIRPPRNLRLSQAMKELNEDGWMWMQYTGLKDKTGKEIYEGDILNLGENSLYFIEYKNDKFCMSKKPDDLEVEWASADDYYTSRISLSEYGKNSEIIGNIFENPELLENNK